MPAVEWSSDGCGWYTVTAPLRWTASSTTSDADWNATGSTGNQWIALRNPQSIYTMSDVTWTWHGRDEAAVGRVEDMARQIRDRRAEIAEVERRHNQRQAQRITAQSRAEELLRSLLTDEQRRCLDRRGYFIVAGSLGNRYRIHLTRYGTIGNVEWLRSNGRVGGRICAHPELRDDLPMGDVALAQMLALQTDEHSFLRVANVHEGPPPPALVTARSGVAA